MADRIGSLVLFTAIRNGLLIPPLNECERAQSKGKKKRTDSSFFDNRANARSRVAIYSHINWRLEMAKIIQQGDPDYNDQIEWLLKSDRGNYGTHKSVNPQRRGVFGHGRRQCLLGSWPI